MKAHIVEAGHFKLDGGAMFGMIPKTMWNRLNPADDNNMCLWAARCLLIETSDQLILIDTGLGHKQSEKFFSYYYRDPEHTLTSSFDKLGFKFEDVTDVILSHLHFDHCGGAVVYNEDKTELSLTFPNANYWVGEEQWNWSRIPNPKEKGSFFDENILPITESGKLNFISNENSVHPSISIIVGNGHTEGLVAPIINMGTQTLVFPSDIAPSAGHISTPFTTGYDIKPLENMEDKMVLLEIATF